VCGVSDAVDWQAFLYKRCFVSLMVAMALNHYVDHEWITAGHEAARLTVQWLILVVGLANHYACSTVRTPAACAHVGGACAVVVNRKE
jgi:hypothetical protein